MSSSIRCATFNVGFDQEVEFGALEKRLRAGDDIQANKVAGIIQRVRPDILLLNEIDTNDEGRCVETFQYHYLNQGQHPIHYPFVNVFESNSGVPCPSNLTKEENEYTYGFGAYPGQYGMAILSQYPILKKQIRTFQEFKWKDLPNHQIPATESGPYYSESGWSIFRLSSKNHAIVPIQIDSSILNIVACHPTPPAFDGKELRNKKRNHDEIELLTAIIKGNDFLIDDNGNQLTKPLEAPFVVMGDLNASTTDGEALQINGKTAISKLLCNERLQPGLDQALVKNGTAESALSCNVPKTPWRNSLGRMRQFDTADWNMRADYILPSKNDIYIVGQGVFWPHQGHQDSELVTQQSTKDSNSSDHRLVWCDIRLNKFERNKLSTCNPVNRDRQEICWEIRDDGYI